MKQTESISHQYNGHTITEYVLPVSKSPFEVNIPVPVIGVLSTRHRTIEDAKDYINKNAK